MKKPQEYLDRLEAIRQARQGDKRVAWGESASSAGANARNAPKTGPDPSRSRSGSHPDLPPDPKPDLHQAPDAPPDASPTDPPPPIPNSVVVDAVSPLRQSLAPSEIEISQNSANSGQNPPATVERRGSHPNSRQNLLVGHSAAHHNRLADTTEAALEVAALIERERLKLDPGVADLPFVGPLIEEIGNNLIDLRRYWTRRHAGKKIDARVNEAVIKQRTATKEMVIDLIHRLPKPLQSERKVPPSVVSWLDSTYGKVPICHACKGPVRVIERGKSGPPEQARKG